MKIENYEEVSRLMKSREYLRGHLSEIEALINRIDSMGDSSVTIHARRKTVFLEVELSDQFLSSGVMLKSYRVRIEAEITKIEIEIGKL